MREPLVSRVIGVVAGRTFTFGHAIATFALLWFAFGYPWLSGRLTIPYDAKALFQAQLQFLATAIHSGQSPAWNPHTFVGVPQIADPQSLIFSPAAFIALIAEQPAFWLLDTFVIALLGMAGLSILMLFRDKGWHPVAACVAALCFAFGGSASWRMQHVGQIQSYAFFALALWLLVRGLDRRSIFSGALAGLAAGLMLVSPDQVALLGAYVMALVVAAWVWSQDSPRRAFFAALPILSVAALFALLVAAGPVLITYLFLSGSNRPTIAYAEAARGSLHPASLLSFFVADLFGVASKSTGYWGPFSEAWDPDELSLSPNMSQLYIGALPAVLLIRAAFRPGDLWRPEVRGFTLAAGLAFVYALGASTPAFYAIYHLMPGVALFRRPADATFLLCGLLAIVSGYLLHRWLTEKETAQATWHPAEVALMVAVAAIGGLVAIRMGKLTDAAVPIAVAAAMIGTTYLALQWLSPPLVRSSAFAGMAVAALAGGDLIVNNGPSEATGKPADKALEVLRPDTSNDTIALLERMVRRQVGTPWRDRIEMAGVGFDWQNAAEAQGLDQTLGYNPLRLAIVSRALGATDYSAGPDQRLFSALFPSYRSRLADLLGLRFIVSAVPLEQIDETLGSDDLHLVARTRDAFIYENPGALPRVMFVETAMGVDTEEILATGRWPDFDATRVVLLDAKDAMGLPVARPLARTSAKFQVTGRGARPSPSDARPAAGSAVIKLYENTVIDVVVTADKPGYLVLADVWHPWWTAKVNGRHVPILKANVMFRSVRVPAGRSTVRFEFEPLTGAADELGRRLAHLARG
jgi:hypothetical protein